MSYIAILYVHINYLNLFSSSTESATKRYWQIIPVTLGKCWNRKLSVQVYRLYCKRKYSQWTISCPSFVKTGLDNILYGRRLWLTLYINKPHASWYLWKPLHDNNILLENLIKVYCNHIWIQRKIWNFLYDQFQGK